MQRVLRVPKDIDFIVYHFVHRDLIKQLNSEYMSIIKVCSCIYCNKVCSRYIIASFLRNEVAYNYRDPPIQGYYDFIYDKWNCSCGELPKNY